MPVDNRLRPLWFHESARLPAFIGQLRDSLPQGVIPNALHYRTQEQAELWQTVSRAHAPAHQRRGFEACYRNFFANTTPAGSAHHVIGLASGGALKEGWLLESLQSRGHRARFTPIDLNPELVLSSLDATEPVRDPGARGAVADIEALGFLPDWLTTYDAGQPRIFTFFGILINLVPDRVLPVLRSLMRGQDRLLVNANLAPLGATGTEQSYAAACQRILPQYDNAETRAWLSWVLRDWGFADWLEPLCVSIGEVAGFRAVVAAARWRKSGKVKWRDLELNADPRQCLRVFFSLRFTPANLTALLHRHGFEILDDALTPCREEGVWLLRKAD